MNENDSERFAKLWSGAWAFYGRPASPMVISLSFAALRQYDFHDISTAISRHLTDPDTGQFPPKPSDIIRILDGSKGSRALIAWSKVEKAVRVVGSYDSVCFDDSIIHAVISEMGGWVDLCQTEEKELPFKAKEFERRYQSYAIDPPKNYPNKLIGICESDNLSKGFSEFIKEPVLVGDIEKAGEIYLEGPKGSGVQIKRFEGGNFGLKFLEN